MEDIQSLKPSCLALVPKLLMKIYASIKGKFADKGCIGRSLINRAVNVKMSNLLKTGSVTDGLYDTLVFGKVKKVLGGNVRTIFTGSAPIDENVLNFLKICFCVNIQEGYGQTESTAGSVVTRRTEKKGGHVGGPVMNTEIRLLDLPDMNYLSTDMENGINVPRGEVLFRGPGIMKG